MNQIIIVCVVCVVIGIICYQIGKSSGFSNAHRKASKELENIKSALGDLEKTHKEDVQKYQESYAQYHKLLDFFNIDQANEESFATIRAERQKAHEETLKNEADAAAKKLEELQQQLAVEQGKLASRAQEEKAQIAQEIEKIRAEIGVWEAKLNESIEHYNAAITQQKNMESEFEELQQKCIKLSDDASNDIVNIYDFIDRLHNKEPLCKFIWSEYLRGPLDALLRKQEIGEVPGIYKITNIITKEAYIGRSVNMRKRIIDHFKSAVGIESIADQEFHHVMREVGFSNFMVEKLCECGKEELNDKEKYYIATFGTRDYGYNKNTGG